MHFSGTLTREQFMFQEMRILAKLVSEGWNEEQIFSRVVEENLFQYPTEREIKSKCRACLKRIACISDMPVLMEALPFGAFQEARQAALIAMMCQNNLMEEFMVTVIGEKYRRLDLTLSLRDMNLFFQRLSEMDEAVAGWTDATVRRIQSVLRRCLMETEYLSSVKSEILLPVTLSDDFADSLTRAGYRYFLPAFNRLD